MLGSIGCILDHLVARLVPAESPLLVYYQLLCTGDAIDVVATICQLLIATIPADVRNVGSSIA